MLQPRLPLRRVCTQCKPLTTIQRGYATKVIDPIAPSTSTTEVAATPSQPQNVGFKAKEEATLRRYTPRTPGIRHLVRPMNNHIWKGRPLKDLTFPKKGHARGGRNRTGRITVRHRGGGHKRRIRVVDFERSDAGEHWVERIEHDPGRSAHIALVRNTETKKASYILAAEGMRAGDMVSSFRQGIPEKMIEEMGGKVDTGVLASKTALRGNCLPLNMIPVGTPIFNISPNAKSKGKIARSAGTHGIILSKGEDTVQKEMATRMGSTGTMELENMQPDMLRRFEKAASYVTVKLSSGEVRLIPKDAYATIGVASNADYKYTQLGKAGRHRWLGIRPTVRGTAMNTVDHPHGGGRGKSKGNKHPMTPWGKPTKSGWRTRSKDKIDHLIVHQRPRNQGKRRKGYA